MSSGFHAGPNGDVVAASTVGRDSVLTLDASVSIGSSDLIGEGPVWDAGDNRFLWSDNALGFIHEARCNDHGEWHETNCWRLGRPLAAAVPRVGGGLAIASDDEILMMDQAGEISPFARLDVDPSQVHLNDAKCDPQGRLWAGTRDTDFSKVGQPITPGRGALYRIDPDGRVKTMVEGVSLSNGMDWSPDGLTMYYIDTYTRRVDAFDFDQTSGLIANRLTVVSIPSGLGLPAGMTVDAEGCLWVAVAGSGEVRRYSTNGDHLATVRVPTPTPTSCAFGGADLSDLFITTARVRLPGEVLTELTHGFSIEIEDADSTPEAGSLYRCRPQCLGQRAYSFAG